MNQNMIASLIENKSAMALRWLSLLSILGALTGAVGQASGEADPPCRAKRRYYKKAYEEIEKLLYRIDVLLRHESPEFDSLQLNAYDDYFTSHAGH